MTIIKMIPLAVLCLLIGWIAVPTLAQAGTDDSAIREIIRSETVAWNQGDAVAYSRHFAADGTFTNILGKYFTGHAAFVNQHDLVFRTIFRGSTLQQDVVSLQFVAPSVAVVNILTAVSGAKIPGSRGDVFDTKGRLRTRLMQVLVRENGEWKIVAYHNVEARDAMQLPEPK